MTHVTRNYTRCNSATHVAPQLHPVHRNYTCCTAATPVTPQLRTLRRDYTRSTAITPFATQQHPLRRNYTRCSAATPGAPQLRTLRRNYTRCTAATPFETQLHPLHPHSLSQFVRYSATASSLSSAQLIVVCCRIGLNRSSCAWVDGLRVAEGLLLKASVMTWRDALASLYLPSSASC